MSEYGLSVKNTDDEIQIDSLFRNYTYNESGNTAVGTGYTNINITDTTKNPIFIIKPSASYSSIQNGFVKSGSTYTHARVLSSGGFTMPWQMFTEGQQSGVPANSYGMLVYDSGGNVVFSSLERYLKIIGSGKGFSLSKSEAMTDYVDVTVEDADNNFFLIYVNNFSCSFYYTKDFMSLPDEDWAKFYASGIRKINSTTLRLSWIYTHTTTTGETCQYCQVKGSIYTGSSGVLVEFKNIL